MSVPVRLDVVVKVKAREEEKRLLVFSKALRSVETAQQALQRAEAEANREGRRRGLAADFSLQDVARGRALEAVRQAQARLQTVAKVAEASKAAWVEAKVRTDAVRRVAETRRSEVRLEEDKRENRELDELAVLRFTSTSDRA